MPAMQPKFIRAQRMGPFTGRSTDVGVVLDLMIHDLDLLLALVQAPVRIGRGARHELFTAQHEDVANARLHVRQRLRRRGDREPGESDVVCVPMQSGGPDGYAEVDFAAAQVDAGAAVRDVVAAWARSSPARSGIECALREELFSAISK